MESARFGLECDPKFEWWYDCNTHSYNQYKRGAKLRENTKEVEITPEPHIEPEIAKKETRLVDSGRKNIRKINICLNKPVRESISERILNGKLLFYNDFVEIQFIRDYAERNNKTLKIIRRNNQIQNIQNINKTIGEKSRKDYEAHPKSIDRSQNDDFIDNLEELDEIQREEIRRGELPIFFNPLKVKQIHPKDKIINPNCLPNYARYVDKITKYPLLHSEMQNIRASKMGDKLIIDSENEVECKKQICDLYNVDKDQIERAREVLNERRQKDRCDDKLKLKIDGRLQKFEEAKIIKGGYAI